MRLFSVLIFAGVAAAQPIQFDVVTESVLQEQLRLASPKNAVRFARLKDLFQESGCRDDYYREQPVKRSKEPNILCSVPGAADGSPRKIIVGAHFDSVGGAGVIDNWSGAVLLPSLAKFSRDNTRRHDFEFIGFAAEEKGLLGSRAYLKSLPKAALSQIAAVIIIDCIGLTPAKYWPNGSDKQLAVAAARIAQALKIDFAGINMDQVGSTDSQTFKEAKIPVLSLHSVTQETLPVINGSKDNWTAVSWKDYYDTYQLVSALLVYLDRELP